MDFGRAIHHLKMGTRVRRNGWNSNGAFVVLMPELKLPAYSSQESGAKVNDRTAKHIGSDTPLDSRPYFAMFTGKKQWQPGWLPNAQDLLAEDWSVVTE